MTRPDRANDLEIEDEAPGPEQAVAQRQQAARVEVSITHALALLSERERLVVREHVLEGTDMSLAALGRTLGVTRQRAGQIWASARNKLRSQLQAVA